MKLEGLSLNLSKAKHEQNRLKEACVEFEAIFISKLLEGLRKTVDKSGFITGGIAEEVFEDMLYDEYAKRMAQRATLGIALKMYEHIKGGKST